MSTPTITLADAQRLLEAEQRAEQRALTALHGATFTDCLTFNGLAPTREVSTPKGKTITIRGSDIYDQRTWKKFLASQDVPEPIYQLTSLGTQTAQRYQAWLLKEHTARYHLLSDESDLAWFEQVVTFAVTRHIMEQKYEGHIKQGLATFADPHVAREVGHLLRLHHQVKEAARLVHHIVKEPTQARQLIELFYQEHERQMQTREPLMPLPSTAQDAQTPAPLAPMTLKEGEEHE